MDGGAGGVPPVGMDEDVAAGCGEQGVTVAEEVEAGVELGHAVLVLGVDEGEGVDAGGVEAAEGVDALEGAEPVEGEKGFVGADAHDAAAAEFGKVERVVGGEGGVAMAGADEADGAYGVFGEMLAEALVKGEKRGLHGFHKQAVMEAGGGEDLLELGYVEGGGFLAEYVLAGGEGLDAEIGVGVGVGGYVDGVDVCG